MTVSKKAQAEAATPAVNSPKAANATIRSDQRDEIADQDLDNVSGGPTAVERNPTPT